MGSSAGAHSLYDFASMLRGGARLVPPLDLAPFWSTVCLDDPLVTFLQSLRRAIPAAFKAIESPILSRSHELLLPRELVRLIEPVCRARGIEFPQVLADPKVGPDLFCLESLPAIVISPKLVESEMPQGALAFAILLGIANLGLGTGPLTYLPTYQLDVIGEVVRNASGKESIDRHSLSLLANAFSLPIGEIEAVSGCLRVSAPSKFCDPLVTKVLTHEKLVQGVLSVTHDLVGALAALSLQAPPTFSLRAASFRWLKHLSKNPTARSTFSYILSNHFAVLQSRSQPNHAASA
jgi:hypothetical protein